jgi:hypothetical protein
VDVQLQEAGEVSELGPILGSLERGLTLRRNSRFFKFKVKIQSLGDCGLPYLNPESCKKLRYVRYF